MVQMLSLYDIHGEILCQNVVLCSFHMSPTTSMSGAESRGKQIWIKKINQLTLSLPLGSKGTVA